ncbi:hypothetical protein Btru_037536 [Bulinus truncatus]|nr:hypothetical protein Btru_037536 [Bulinus truncatus]
MGELNIIYPPMYDTINISLFALGISEICSLLPIIWAGVLSEPRFIPFEVWFSGKEVLSPAAGWPHAIFAKLTSWITAYIMFERCLCVALPLKVKMFLTPVRVKICLLSTSVLVFTGLLPTYMTHSLNWKCYPHLNRTLLGLTLTDNALEVTHYTNFINNSVSALVSFNVILLCTLIIIFKLNQKTKWRNETVKMDTKQSRNVYRKDRRAVKMVITLSGIFLVIIVIWANFLHAEFGMLNRYGNLFNISYCVTYVMESVSSSLNIVVYYKMNLQYRRTLRTMTSKLMGKISNIINLIIFAHHGFKDTVNISLFTLALSDLCSLVPLIWTGVFTNPHLQPPDVSFSGQEVQFITGSWPHTILARLTGWITAYIMFERCLCIALPLHVKILLTPFRVKCCLVLICVVVLAGVLPTYLTHTLGWKFYPMLNRTLLGLVLSDDALEVTHVSNFLNNPLSEFASFGITAVCTLVIVIQLKRKSKWRQSTRATTVTSSAKTVSSKDHKAVKMVTALSLLFLVTVTPSIIVVIGSIIDDDFGLFGRYRNIFNMSYCVIFILESLNSGVTIVVYYTMNRRFKRTFWFLFYTSCRSKKAASFRD